MTNHLKRLGGESLVYGLGQVSGRAVQFLLVPVLTRALAPDAYAVSELVMAYSQTAILVLVLGMDGALARHFYHEPDREARVRMVSSSFVFRLLTGVTAGLALSLLAPALAPPLMGSPAYTKYLAVGATTLPLTLLVLFANDVLRVTFQPWKFIVLNTAQTVLATGIALWLVLVAKIGVIGVLYGKLAADAVCAGLGLVLIRHTLLPRFSRDALSRMLAYGVPLVPGAMAYGIMMGVDRFVLQRTRSLEEVAVYAVGAKFFALVSMAVSAFQLAYGPFAFSLAGRPEAPRVYSRVLVGFVAAAALLALALALFAGDLLRWAVPSAYQAAAPLVAWLAFAAVAHGAYSIASVGISLALKTHLLIWTAGTAAILACAAQALLTPRLGAPGAAAATLLGYGVSAMLTYWTAQRVHPLPYRGALTLTLFAAGLVLALAIPRVAPSGASGLGVKLLTLLAFTGLCAATGVWWKRAGWHSRQARPDA